MKAKLTLLISALPLLVASCGSLQSFEKRKYRPGFYVSVTDNKQQMELLSNDKEEKQTEVKETNTDTVPVKKDTAQVLVISDKVGDVIDSAEKAKYKLFPYWSAKDFQSAQFIQESDLKIYVVGTMKDGTIKKMPCSVGSYQQLAKNVFGEKKYVAEKTAKEKPSAQLKSAKASFACALVELACAGGVYKNIKLDTVEGALGAILLTLICFVFAVMALAFGIGASTYSSPGEKYEGRGMAIFGIYCGLFAIMGIIIALQYS